MKNIIPLVVAVVLGFAAVFAVSRTISKQTESQPVMVDVVVASRALAVNETIEKAFVNLRSVPAASLPKQHIKWANLNMILGQKVLHAIPKDDYVLLSDVGMTRSMGNEIGDGEWGVPVSFSGSLVKMLQPGDDIAIVGSYKVKQTAKSSKDANVEDRVVDKTVTSVIFPRVRILKIVGSDVILSLPPQKAIALTAIQRVAELYPLLRKTDDSQAIDRKACGLFEDSALMEMIDGVTSIKIGE